MMVVIRGWDWGAVEGWTVGEGYGVMQPNRRICTQFDKRKKDMNTSLVQCPINANRSNVESST
jgi:hypothetical protein